MLSAFRDELAKDELYSHSVYNDVGPVKTHFSAYFPGSVFSLARNLFSATKVRCSNRSMEPFQFHQSSIRSRPVSGP
jgi:hypothetical protein